MTVFQSKNESDTVRVAQLLAEKVKTGTIIALYGTLGVGKTVFCRGFIHALLKQNVDVPSPTFTLLQIYDAPDFPVYHFDLYRLKQPDEAYEIGIEDAFAEGVSLIEWPEKLGNILPQNHIGVTITACDNGRIIEIKGLDI